VRNIFKIIALNPPRQRPSCAPSSGFWKTNTAENKDSRKVTCCRASAVQKVSNVVADFSGWIQGYVCEECSGYTNVTLVREVAYIQVLICP